MSLPELPSPSPNQNYVSVHALSSGFLTLPENVFVHPSVEGNRNTVPSLSFLIQHQDPASDKLTRVIFDLGLRRDLKKYPPGLQAHLKSREPLTTSPDTSESLRLGGLEPTDVDVVILSHVHWDHVGTPSDFSKSQFIVGNGSVGLLRSGDDPKGPGGHEFYEPDLLPQDRTTELPPTDSSSNTSQSIVTNTGPLSNPFWEPLGPFPNAIDIFSDGSVYIVSAPGHLPGHVNLLARLARGKWVYLAGDACHDRRLLRKEKEIALWVNHMGQLTCIHHDKSAAEKTIDLIANLEQLKEEKVEVVLAHDIEWIDKPENKGRFWPGEL